MATRRIRFMLGRAAVVGIALLMLPLPAQTAGATNTGQAVTQFYNCTDRVLWQSCQTGSSAGNFTVVGGGINANQVATDFGFRFPVNGVATSADLDVSAQHGYKDRQVVQNSQGTWNQPGNSFQNTTSLFGLRIDLDHSSPFGAINSSDPNQTFATGSTASDVAAGDFNGDGTDDLAVLAGNTVQVRTYRGGNWLNSTNYSIPTGTPRGLKAADLNQDGRADLVAATYTGGTAYVYNLIQTPYGAMRVEGPITIVSGGSCSGTYCLEDFAVGDLNGDGYPDVAVVYGGRVSYWVNAYAGKNLDFWGADDYSVKVQSVSYSNRASFIASAPANCSGLVAQANLNSNIYIYNQTNLATVATLSSHTDQVLGLAWSPDCQYLASASNDKTVKIWRTSNWTVSQTLSSHTNTVYSVAFSPDSTLLASGGADSLLKVWNLTVFPANLDYNVSDLNGTINSLAFSPNGSYLVQGNSNGAVRVRATSDYSLVSNMTGHNASFAVRTLAFTQDGLSLISGSDDNRMLVWDMGNLTNTLAVTVFGEDVTRVALNTNGTRLIAASADGHVRTFLISNWTVLEDIVEGSQFVYAADFDRTGENLITAGTSSYVRLWDKSTLLPLGRVQTGQQFTILALAYSPTGMLAAASEDGTVLVEWPSNGTQVARFQAHNGTANRVAWSPAGDLLVTAGSDGAARVWTVANWSLAANLTSGGNVSALDFSSQGMLIATGNSSGGISLWSASNYTRLASGLAPSAVVSLAFDPTGANLVSGGAEATVRIWNTSAVWNFQNLTGPTGTLKAVDWSPDGTQVAAAGTERRVRTWWTGNWTLNYNVSLHTNDILSLTYSPNSVKLASAGLDAKIYVWASNGTLLQQYTTAPSNPTQVWSVAWSADSRRLAAGWQDNRFPVSNSAACSCSSASITTHGIAIGPGDANSGNDIIIVGYYPSSWNADSGVWVLPFSSGVPAAQYTLVTNMVNQVPDAYRVALGDLSGDGRADLAVLAETASSGSLYLFWWNATANRFDATGMVTIPVGASGNALAIADVTDDGHNDVVLAAGTGTNELQVVYYEEGARTTGAFKLANVSHAAAPAVGDAPLGLAIGHFENDTLNDTATANGGAASVNIYRQKDQLFGTYISPPINDTALPGNPIVTARLYWDDYNVVANQTTFNASVTVDGGFRWVALVENQSVALQGTNSTSLQYKFDFRSAHAGITAWVLAVWILYTVETTPQDIALDVGRDFTPVPGECYFPGQDLGLYHCSFSGDVVNQYIADNWNQQDPNGTVYIPIRILWNRPASIGLSNLSIPYNFWPNVPALLSPGPGVFSDATPTFVVSAADSDSDNLHYQIQVSGDPQFNTVTRTYDQNTSATCWGLPFYVAGVNAVCSTPDADRLLNGQKYYWRARAFDGLQWSLWSFPSNFTVDDLAPEGFAISPRYSTVETFTVSWSATDPAGGSGLAPAPYEVQFKDGLDGAWTDWVNGTSATSAVFFGTNGNLYCFRMRAADIAGNQQIYSTGTAGDTCTQVDADRPSSTIADLPPFQQSRAFEVRWSGDDGPSGSGIASYDVQVKPQGGAFTPWLTGFAGDHATYSAPDDKVYCFRVATRDRAGNIGDPSGESCTRVDTTPPTCTVSVPSATTTSLSSFPVTFSCVDPDTGVSGYEYALGTGPGIADVLLPQAVASPISIILMPNGTLLQNGGSYFANVRAANAAGSFSAWVSSREVRVLIPGPSATIRYPDGVYTTPPGVNISIDASDALHYAVVSGELQYRRAPFRYNQLGVFEDWLTISVDPSNTTYLFDLLVRGYVYEFQYRARNEVGSWGDYAKGGSLAVNQLPVASAGQDRVANLSEEVLLDGRGSLDYDGDRDTLTYSWELDDGRNFTGPTATVHFTDAGTHRAILTVSDGHEAATATVYIFVPPAAPRQIAPGFDGVLVLAALVGAAALVAGRRRRPEA